MDVFTQGACNRGSKVPVFATTLSIASACESGLVLHAASSPTSLTKGINAEQLMSQYDIACCKIKLILSRLYSLSIAYGSSACGQNEELKRFISRTRQEGRLYKHLYSYKREKLAPSSRPHTQIAGVLSYSFPLHQSAGHMNEREC